MNTQQQQHVGTPLQAVIQGQQQLLERFYNTNSTAIQRLITLADRVLDDYIDSNASDDDDEVDENDATKPFAAVMRSLHECIQQNNSILAQLPGVMLEVPRPPATAPSSIPVPVPVAPRVPQRVLPQQQTQEGILDRLFGQISASMETQRTANVATVEQLMAQHTTTTPFSQVENPRSTVCPISQNEFAADTEVTVINHCRHVFNSEDLRQWLERTPECPVCRHRLTSQGTLADRVASTQPRRGRDEHGEYEEVVFTGMSIAPLGANNVAGNATVTMDQSFTNTIMQELARLQSDPAIVNSDRPVPIRISTTIRDTAGNIVNNFDSNFTSTNLLNNLRR